MNLPKDATKEEKQIYDYSLVHLYAKLNDEQKFIVAFVYELGYKKMLAAEILGISPAKMTGKLKQIKSLLKTSSKNK